VDDGKLLVEAVGPLPVLDFEIGKPEPVPPLSNAEFCVDGGDHTRIRFIRDASGRVSGAVLNSGPWEIRGTKERVGGTANGGSPSEP
jgi:hypothetical protein